MEKQTEKKVVTRFPPSPTGFLHIGRARTALFNYLFAQSHGGDFIFRLEDTDTARSKPEFEADIIAGLRWLNIPWDNKTIVRQSERSAVYKQYLKKIIESGKAYLSKEKVPIEGGRDEVIRFKNPNKTITFHDLIRGEVTFDTTDLGDFVIAKSLDEPIYHLTVVVDDLEMGVSHVIRGEDGISNTPRQILIQEAIGAPRPVYAHLPLILAADRSKLSGRHGAVGVTEYKNMGYLPEAIINYLALLGWNPGTDQEIFTVAELVKVFDLSKVQKGGAIFNIEKLNWFNKQYIQKLSPAQKLTALAETAGSLSEEERLLFSEKIKQLENKPVLIELISERINTFGELRTALLSGEYDYFFTRPHVTPAQLFWKGESDSAKVKARLATARTLIEATASGSFTKESVKEALWPYAEKEGRGEVLWPVRISLSGKEKSPDPFTLAEILGKEETLSRIADAINLLS